MSWFARQKTQKIAKGVRSLIIIFSLLIAIILVIGGRVLFSLPLFFLALSALKIKGLTAIQIFQLWRLIQYLRNSGRFSYYGQTNQTASSSAMSLNEAYKILGLKEGCTKEEVKKAANNIQKKIHPDVSPETARLSALVNEARDIVLKNIS
tara:strand:- start:2415 stop:2867 length:453 start_codon:yes stop_codon:yes gene_type:complete